MTNVMYGVHLLPDDKGMGLATAIQSFEVAVIIAFITIGLAIGATVMVIQRKRK